MHDPEYARGVLGRLNHMGIEHTYRQFRDGLLIVRLLEALSTAYLKIDHFFVRGLSDNLHNEHRVRSIVALTHNMELP